MIRAIFIIFILSLIKSEALSNNSSKDALRSTKLPPCAACKALFDSFKQGMTRTERGKFEGGDAAWEEEKMRAYKISEVRLVEIQEKLCSEVERGQTQCEAANEEHESLIEEWWFSHQDSEPNLHKWLCIEKLLVCCPLNHYGADCQPCKGGIENPCNGNGRCKGNGTRKGNGECDCHSGYEGDQCNGCSMGHFEAYRDDTKLLCDPCHKACQGHCTQAGPKSCTVCKLGWFMDSDNGCLDINECITKVTPCRKNEFCVNNEGSFTCMKCHKSCNGCNGDGPDMCEVCAKGFTFENDACIETIEEEETADDKTEL